MSLNLVQLLLYLSSAVLSGTYLTILGNQAPERGESKTALILHLRITAEPWLSWVDRKPWVTPGTQRSFIRLSDRIFKYCWKRNGKKQNSLLGLVKKQCWLPEGEGGRGKNGEKGDFGGGMVWRPQWW